MRNEISTELEPTRRGDGRLRYTDKERAIHRLIASADGAVRTTDVVGAFYRDRRPPTHPRIAVGAILNTLRHKLDFNGHPCGLAKSSGRPWSSPDRLAARPAYPHGDGARRSRPRPERKSFFLDLLGIQSGRHVDRASRNSAASAAGAAGIPAPPRLLEDVGPPRPAPCSTVSEETGAGRINSPGRAGQLLRAHQVLMPTIPSLTNGVPC